jgi:hypothetical protein
MNTTIKLAALGAIALAASSTAALAYSEMPAGVTTGIALGAPLPEGVYDISVASYGSRTNGSEGQNIAYALPVWLIWSTPWQIAGGRIAFDTTTGVADAWSPGYTGADSWLNTLVEGSIAWKLSAGWNVSLRAGAWLPSTQTLPMALGRDYTAFQGGGSISYLANGWNLTATALYGQGRHSYNSMGAQQADWLNLDLTATKKFGKMEIGAIAYGSWDLNDHIYNATTYPFGTGSRQSQFAAGGLVGYDFGSFIAQAKLATDLAATDLYPGKETRGTLTIIKPLWNPASDGPLK